MNRFGHLLISQIFASFLIWNITSMNGLAQESEAQETVPKQYAKDHVFLSVLPLNEPYGQTKGLLKMEGQGFGVKYAHRLASEWIVGLGFKRKPVIARDDDRPLALIQFTTETRRIFRLYHPLYFLAGTEISFLTPAQKSTPPFTKDPKFATEIAGSLNASLWWLSSRKGAVELQISRWKGTKSNRLQGLEVSLGYGIGFQ